MKSFCRDIKITQGKDHKFLGMKIILTKDKRIDIPDSVTAVFSPKSAFILLPKMKGAKK